MTSVQRITTLVYAFDRDERLLLLQRQREPNRGLWSPPGGKIDPGETPLANAAPAPTARQLPADPRVTPAGCR
jgi:ADP-ribose pyrophosphatase YjhB (NUDIX family)